jgi:hypothetical protein
MLTRRPIATTAAALALLAAAPAGAAAAQPDPVVNWTSPVTGRDMRTENPQYVPPASTPAPARHEPGGLSPLVPVALVAVGGVAVLGAGTRRRHTAAVRSFPA